MMVASGYIRFTNQNDDTFSGDSHIIEGRARKSDLEALNNTVAQIFYAT